MEENEPDYFRFWRAQMKNHLKLYERQRPVEVRSISVNTHA